MIALADMFFLCIALYLLYRFVFNFLVPVVRTTRQVRKQFRNMQDAMQDPAGPFQQQPFGQPQQPRPQPQSKPHNGTSASSGKMGEYIDFEEIK